MPGIFRVAEGWGFRFLGFRVREVLYGFVLRAEGVTFRITRLKDVGFGVYKSL